MRLSSLQDPKCPPRTPGPEESQPEASAQAQESPLRSSCAFSLDEFSLPISKLQN